MFHHTDTIQLSVRSHLGKVPKKLAGGSAPDLEEAYEVRPIVALFRDITHVVPCYGRLMITAKTCLRMRKRRM